MKNKNLAKKINDMALIDQNMRKKVEKGEPWDYSVDRGNTEEMRNILKKYGWPTIQMVGKTASKNAWLLVQHADHNLSFQRKALSLMKKTLKEDSHSVDRGNIAYLTDRILVKEKRKQEFGTQFYINRKNKLTLRPVRDMKNVNKRRSEYGLNPIEEYLKDAEKYIVPKE